MEEVAGIKKSKPYRLFYWGVVIMVVVCGFLYLKFHGSINSANEKNISHPQPAEVIFAGEVVPLDNIEVKDRFFREIYYHGQWHSHTYLFNRRAVIWFPVIEPVLRRFGIPDDFKYLAVAESELSNRVSPKGAAGFWQLMNETAVQFGLTINGEMDERYHIKKSTEAACRYLVAAYREFNNWTLTAASFNGGMERMKRQLQKQQVDNFYSLKLNEQTTSYIYRVLVIKELMENPEKYGYKLLKPLKQKPFPVKVISIDTSLTDLQWIAIQYGVSSETMKALNPWITGNKLTVGRNEQYEITVPKEGFEEFIELTFRDTAVLKPEDEYAIALDSMYSDSAKAKEGMDPNATTSGIDSALVK